MSSSLSFDPICYYNTLTGMVIEYSPSTDNIVIILTLMIYWTGSFSSGEQFGIFTLRPMLPLTMHAWHGPLSPN